MKAGLDSADEEDAYGPEMETDVNSDDAYGKHALMLSRYYKEPVLRGVSKCLCRGSSGVERFLGKEEGEGPIPSLGSEEI